VSKQFVRVATGAAAHRHGRYVDFALPVTGRGRPITATFDAGRLSSDGGVIVLRKIATRPRPAPI
jgi:hypothetical protein